MRTLLIYLIILSYHLSSQIPADSVNRYNDKHKKHGFWTIYLDKYTNPTEKNSALYIGYELYDNGLSVFFFPTYKKIYTIEYNGPKTSKGKPVLLNGTIKLFYPSGKLSYESTYYEGRPVSQIAYDYNKNGVCTMKEVLDYSKKYNQIDGTHYYELFGEHGKLVNKGYYRKEKRGWRVYSDEL